MNDEQKQKLWDDYYQNPTQELRNKIITEYSCLVNIVASKLQVYFDGNTEYEDMVSYGIFGLIDAIYKYNKDMDTKFETYASLRIRGSILDHIRKLDWVPRSIREKQGKVNRAKKSLISSGIHHPTNQEIADELGITEDEYCSWEVSFIPTMIDHIDESIDGDNEDNGTKGEFLEQYTFVLPEDQVLQDELKEKLYQSIQLLSDREQQIVKMYYFENLTMKEIGNIMGVTESRASQLHKRSIAKMKSYLQNDAGILFI